MHLTRVTLWSPGHRWSVCPRGGDRLVERAFEQASDRAESGEEIADIGALGRTRAREVRSLRFRFAVECYELRLQPSSGGRVRQVVPAAQQQKLVIGEFVERSGDRSPGALRRGGAGEEIRTAFADCPFGRLLVGATGKGVCFLGFAAPDETLLGALHRRFPRARIIADDTALAHVVRAVLEFIAEPKQALSLPLDLRGTAFQQRVWRALCRIPPGETRSYAEVAAMIEAPRAIRAVARSCAANPVALAVPCHRVVGSSGELTGYRWGVSRKRTLLERERTAARSAHDRAQAAPPPHR